MTKIVIARRRFPPTLQFTRRVDRPMLFQNCNTLETKKTQSVDIIWPR